ncbi:hypothetical protein EVAR_22005_1 [Eumeta japonica]|uniref:Uncharacterized protein n=1 Tax=Eumeta variegata TaxID=151549 RepID=A0A4C1YYR0_EUMVA|nr:hypothetical protein EVAR_22005_1 [Eumeta japonica]
MKLELGPHQLDLLQFCQPMEKNRIINQYDIAKVFTEAYLKSPAPLNAISGFRASSIYPFNRHVIGDEHFAPSEVYQVNAANISETNEQNTPSSANSCPLPDFFQGAPSSPVPASPQPCTAPRSPLLDITRTNIRILEEIRAKPAKVKNRNSKSVQKQQQSEILTSTPVKMEQKITHDAAAAKKRFYSTPLVHRILKK